MQFLTKYYSKESLIFPWKNILPLNSCMMELNVIVSDAPETGQYLSERCHDQIFCAMAESKTKLTLIWTRALEWVQKQV